MPQVVAKGLSPSECWRRQLRPGEVICLGRVPRNGWEVPWDSQISREHVTLLWRDDRLQVKRLPRARNPVFYRGHEVQDFRLKSGEHFVIGTTSFCVTEEQATANPTTPSPVEQYTFRPGDLEHIQFRNADHRLEVLSHLPDVIGKSHSDDELYVRLVSMLLAGIPHAEAVALVKRTDSMEDDGSEVNVMHWDRRRDAIGSFQPSQRLVLEVVECSKSILHVWSEQNKASPEFTVSENMDWAFCTTVIGEACEGWALYVAGGFAEHEVSLSDSLEDLKGDLRFSELFAQLIGSLRQVKLLERRHSRLSQFFSSTVLDTISRDRSGRGLDPKETDVTVLFCDLRGFSREAEHWRDDLTSLLRRVSDALGVMTHHILQQGGVIGDVQGDAAMGFWGWPLPGQDGPLAACHAALTIHREFRSTSALHSLNDFQVGIGIAHGRAVAGKIGTTDQAKVTVFGPTVNLASRLEGMTRQLRVAILMDESTANCVARYLPSRTGRCRRLGKVLPYGMETPLMVSELLPPAGSDSFLSDQNVADYNAAVDALLQCHWSDALELLHRLPAKDRAKDFLTFFIAQHNYDPPANWDGVIPMPNK